MKRWQGTCRPVSPTCSFPWQSAWRSVSSAARSLPESASRRSELSCLSAKHVPRNVGCPSPLVSACEIWCYVELTDGEMWRSVQAKRREGLRFLRWITGLRVAPASGDLPGMALTAPTSRVRRRPGRDRWGARSGLGGACHGAGRRSAVTSPRARRSFRRPHRRSPRGSHARRGTRTTSAGDRRPPRQLCRV